jgi:hypothetical protein
VTRALLPPARAGNCCGKCGGRLTCAACDGEDIVAAARQAVGEVVRGIGGRNAAARITAAKLVLAKDYMEHLSDEDLLAEVRRRALSRKAE